MRSVLSLFLLLLVSLLLCEGCASRSPFACPDQAHPRAAKIFFATDRQQVAGGGLQFGGDRNKPPGLHMGWEEVVLGPKHRLGALDSAVLIEPGEARYGSDTDIRLSAIVNKNGVSKEVNTRRSGNEKYRLDVRESRLT